MALLAQWGLLRVREAFQLLQCPNFYATRLWASCKYGLFTREGVDAFPSFYRRAGCSGEFHQSGQSELSRPVTIELFRENVL